MEDKVNRPFVIHPWKTMLGVFLVAVVVLFFALTVLFLSHKPLSEVFPFQFPIWGWVGIGVLVLSSLLLESARSAMKQRKPALSMRRIWRTKILGWIFIATQLLFFYELNAQGIDIRAHTAGAYLYILTGLHGLHVVAGAIVLIVINRALRKRPDSPKTHLSFSVGGFFWHFLAVLWVYLVVVMFSMT